MIGNWRPRAADKLDLLLREQEGAQLAYYKALPRELKGNQRADYLRTMVLAATDELHELLAETNWKPWRAGNRAVSRTNFLAELADVQLFVFNLALAEGVTGGELLDAVDKAIKKNAQRRRSGY